MPRKPPRPRPLADSQAEQELIVYFEERAAAPDSPLTVEELMRDIGDLDAAVRLARLKADPAAEDPPEA
jgi:hypothetical protein